MVRGVVSLRFSRFEVLLQRYPPSYSPFFEAAFPATHVDVSILCSGGGMGMDFVLLSDSPREEFSGINFSSDWKGEEDL